LVQNFTVCMPLLTATSAFGLGKTLERSSTVLSREKVRQKIPTDRLSLMRMSPRFIYAWVKSDRMLIAVRNSYKHHCHSPVSLTTCHARLEHTIRKDLNKMWQQYTTKLASFFAIAFKTSILIMLNLPSVLWRCSLGGRKGTWPVKTEWLGAGVVICLQRGADLHMVQLMPLPLTVSRFSKIHVLPFWYWLTRVVPEKGPLNACVCVCILIMLKKSWQIQQNMKMA